MSSERLPCGRPRPKSDVATRKQALSDARWQEMLQGFLQEKGLKHSDQRIKIMELILEIPGHFSVQDVVARVQDAQPSIGAATVYRNIKLLCDAGILQETLTNPSGQTIYEMARHSHHDHIVCTTCGHIFEFESDEIEEAQDRITRRLSFEAVHHRHVIYAKCRYAK